MDRGVVCIFQLLLVSIVLSTIGAARNHSGERRWLHGQRGGRARLSCVGLLVRYHESYLEYNGLLSCSSMLYKYTINVLMALGYTLITLRFYTIVGYT